MPKVTSADGTIIAYDKKGEGPVLILVLGALNKRGSGKKLTDLLKDRFTVLSYDRRGRGDSTDTLPYSTEKEVQDIEAIINANGGQAYLYGHSSGAILSLLAAAALGDKVKRLALYELPHYDDPEAEKASVAYRQELKQLLDSDQPAEAVALFIKSVGVSDRQLEALKKLPMWKGLVAMAPTLAYDFIALMEAYPAIDLAAIAAPALVMAGGASPDFMLDTAAHLVESLPNSTKRILDGQGHDVKAEVLVPVLVEFLS